MIYRVLYNGKDIYGDAEDLTLINPSLDVELNTAGSFQFTMPTSHLYYSSPTLLTPDVEIYEDNKLIFSGRPISLQKDWYNQWVVYCEGALAFFNDSIQRPRTFYDYSIREFFKYVINAHNELVPANRKFTIGNITIQDKLVYRKLDYESTYEVLQDMCVNAEGGYLFTRKENGVNYIDWLSSMPYTSDQPIQFGLNLMDLNQILDGSDIVTSVIPLGDRIDDTDEKLTIKSVNNSKDYIDSAAVSTYGRITKVVDFDGISNASTLMAFGEAWLSDQQFDRLTIECDAADLHYVDGSQAAFRVGQTIHVASTPHLIDKDFPLSKISLNLDSGVKQITIGTVPRKDLTEIYEPVKYY